ncbi:MAG: T9SS type A sorting domain-containing protein [Ignavibacteriaceae bacterium]|nr:T9SS type A sorting domain-containing protein [Ignavibacteriaceae bacterium]
MRKYILFISIILMQINLYPQYSMENPAPLKPDNYWLYSSANGDKFSINILDSTATIDSNLYTLVEGKDKYGKGYGYYRLDSNNFYITYNWSLFTNLEVKYYKKDAILNDSWTNTFSGDPHTAYYKIIDTSTINFYGNATLLKTLEITDSALVYQLQYWSDDYGLLSVTDWEGASSHILGCVINGKVYGDTIFTGIIEKGNIIPKKYYLSQNYPNPFNPSTKIDFNIPKSSHVTMKVYDILGKEITTLINKEMKPGSYTVDFNGNNLSSGVYIYVLKTIDYSEVKKMILLR